MNQLALQFNIRRNPFSWNLTHLLIVGLFLLGLGYAFFVERTVRNAIMSEGARAEISRLISTLGELETRYLELSAAVTTERAEALGFRAVPESKYLARPSLGTVLSVDNEI